MAYQSYEGLRLPLSHPTTIYYDNMSAIKFAINQVFHECTKHIEIDCHLIREKVQQGTVKLHPIHTALQLVDILTKPLPPSTFQNINSKLGTIKLCQSCGKLSKYNKYIIAFNFLGYIFISVSPLLYKV